MSAVGDSIAPLKDLTEKSDSARPQRHPASLAATLATHVLVGLGAALLFSLVEQVDLNIQLSPVFSSSSDRLVLLTYCSLNLLVGAMIGLLVGLVAYTGGFLYRFVEKALARGGNTRMLHRPIALVALSLAAAALLYPVRPVYRFALSLVREAGKIRFGDVLYKVEGPAVYLSLAGGFFACAVLYTLTMRSGRMSSLMKKVWLAGLTLVIAATYYIDSRIEVQQYEYSLHRLMFLTGLTLAMALVGSLFISYARPLSLQPARRKIILALAILVLIALAGFTFARFDRNQNLKTQVFYRSTGMKQYFKLIQWALDRDRDGYSPYLGGGDSDDTRADVNPGQVEIIGDNIDNNLIGGDLSEESLEEWKRERRSLHAPATLSAKPYNVIYIFIDTLRASHLGAYGYSRNITPNIDKLAARSFVFENGFTPSPSTFEAVPKFMQSSYWDAHLDPWPEVLYQNGYDTILFPGRRIETIPRRINAAHMRVQEKTRTVKKTIDDAIKLIGELPQDRPFCAYIYSSEPHMPYKRYEDYNFGSSPADLYDGEIAYSDYHYGRLFDWLEETGRLDNTMIILMADHGESLGERGVYKHTSQVYNEQMKVPMIFYVPHLAPRRIPDYVSTIDLGSTILSAVGLNCPEGYAGISLLPLMRGEPVNLPPVYGEHVHLSDSPFVEQDEILDPETRKYMIIAQDGYKLIYNRDPHSFELYDLKSDPQELRNLYDRMPEKAESLNHQLGRFIDIVSVSRPPDTHERKYSLDGPSVKEIEE